LQPNGNGIQSVYLTELPQPFAEVLAGLIGAEAQSLIGSISVGTPMQTNDDLDWWEHRIENQVESDAAIPSRPYVSGSLCQGVCVTAFRWFKLLVLSICFSWFRHAADR